MLQKIFIVLHIFAAIFVSKFGQSDEKPESGKIQVLRKCGKPSSAPANVIRPCAPKFCKNVSSQKRFKLFVLNLKRECQIKESFLCLSAHTSIQTCIFIYHHHYLIFIWNKLSSILFSFLFSVSRRCVAVRAVALRTLVPI